MEIRQREVRGVVILDLAGRFVLEDGVNAFGEQMSALIRKGHKKILLNFEAVTYLDSAAVGAVAWKYVTANKHKGDVRLLNLHVRSFTILEKTRLLTVIKSYDNEEAAIESFTIDGAEEEDIDPIFT
jgi:anti-anti-sigma factor